LRQKNVLEYLDQTVLRLPEKTAFVDGQKELTFSQLHRYSRCIGSGLADGGYCREPIAVMLGHTVEAIAAFFGCVRAGCWYVPLDEAMGIGRIQRILDQMKPKALIFCAATEKALRSIHFQGKLLEFSRLVNHPENENLLGKIHADQIDTDPLYAVFTSGSTGTPKGVVASHRSVIDYIEALSEVLNLNGQTVFGNQSPLYFDACLKELYPTIKFGATTYLIPRHLFSFPVRLVEYLNAHKINTICWVSSALTMITAMDTFRQIRPTTLHTVAFGSEVFPSKQLQLWRQALPDARFTNLYGPTECTGMSCYHHVTQEDENGPIPIGRPFPNTRIYLLNEENRPAPKGEICISGTCLTLGYYAEPEKTDAVFVPNPMNPNYRELLYRTGDLAKRNSRGELVFIGRKDHQIKRMGHRIELGEIEAITTALKEVDMACCVYHKDRLVLYYTGSEQIGTALRQQLPRYMLPNEIIRLNKMPLTENGKLDRQGLKRRLEE